MPWLQQRQGKFYVCYWENGKKIRKSLKTDNEEEAKKILESYQISDEQHSQEDAILKLFSAKRKQDIQLNRCLISDIWNAVEELPAPRNLSTFTIKGKLYIVNLFTKWVKNNLSHLKYIDELTEKHAAQYIASMKDKAGRTRLNHLSGLSSVFAILLIPYNLERNIWKSVVRNEAVSVRKQNLSLEQIKALFIAAENFTGRVKYFWQTAVPLGFYTGLRLFDVCTLSWDEIDMKNKTITLIPSKTKKQGKELSFTLRDEFGRYLKKLYRRQKTGYVWPGVAEARLKNANWINEEFSQICKNAEIETQRKPEKGEGKKTVVLVGFHSLRHTFVTTALDMGIPDMQVTKAVGHGSPVMTGRYDHTLGAGRQISSSLPEINTKPQKSEQ